MEKVHIWSLYFAVGLVWFLYSKTGYLTPCTFKTKLNQVRIQPKAGFGDDEASDLEKTQTQHAKSLLSRWGLPVGERERERRESSTSSHSVTETSHVASGRAMQRREDGDGVLGNGKME